MDDLTPQLCVLSSSGVASAHFYRLRGKISYASSARIGLSFAHPEIGTLFLRRQGLRATQKTARRAKKRGGSSAPAPDLKRIAPTAPRRARGLVSALPFPEARKRAQTPRERRRTRRVRERSKPAR